MHGGIVSQLAGACAEPLANAAAATPADGFYLAAREQRGAANPFYELGEIDAGGAGRLR
jgi:hypothetical protein